MKSKPTQKDFDALSTQRKRILSCIPADKWIEVTELCKRIADVDKVLFNRNTISSMCHSLVKSNFIEMKQHDKLQKVRRIPLAVPNQPKEKIMSEPKKVDTVAALDLLIDDLTTLHERTIMVLMTAQEDLKRLKNGDPELNEYKTKYLKLKELLS